MQGGVDRIVTRAGHCKAGTFGLYRNLKMSYTPHVLRPGDVLTARAVEALGVLDTCSLHGQDIISIGVGQLAQVKVKRLVAQRRDADQRGIEGLAVTSQGDVIGRERGSINRLVEVHSHIGDRFADVNALVRQTIKRFYLKLSVRLGLERDKVAVGHARDLNHIVQAVLVEPVGTVDERAVGRPDIVGIDGLAIALTNDAHYLLAAYCRVDNRTVVPARSSCRYL